MSTPPIGEFFDEPLEMPLPVEEIPNSIEDEELPPSPLEE